MSVLMPVRNEGAFIEESLSAVEAQDYPADLMQIIVADGMSTDGTRDTLFAHARRDSRLEVIDNPGRIVSTGLNRATRRATGDVYVRVDGHCLVAPDYVRRCVELLLREGVDGVGGPIDTVGKTPESSAIAAAMSSPFGVGGSGFRTGRELDRKPDTIPFPAYTAGIVDVAGPYDEELVRNQDDEYNYRIRELGGRLLLHADIRSTYFSRATLRSLARQYLQYGFYKVRVIQKHPRQARIRQFAPPAFAASLLVALPAAILNRWGRALLALVLLPYTAAAFLATVSTVDRMAGSAGPSPRAGARVAAAFVLMHIGYGLGFLAGLVRFAGRWGERR